MVQVKFYGTPQTSRHIHKEYVLARDGKARNEFFLLAHWGDEEDAKAFLLTAVVTTAVTDLG